MRTKGGQRYLRIRKFSATRTGVGVLAVAALAVGGVLAAAKAPAATQPTSKWGGGHLSISKEFFGSTVEPYTGKVTPTFRYNMTNARGLKVQLL